MSVPWACLLPAPHVLPPWAGTRWSRGLFLSHLRRHEMQGNTWHSTTIWQGALLWPYVSLPNLDRQGNIFTFKNQFLNVCACVYKHSKFLLDTEMWGFSGSKRKFLPSECRLGADHLLRSEHVLCLAFSSKMLGPVCHSVLRESFGFQVANPGCRCCVPRHKGWDKMTEKEQRFVYAHGSTGWGVQSHGTSVWLVTGRDLILLQMTASAGWASVYTEVKYWATPTAHGGRSWAPHTEQWPPHSPHPDKDVNLFSRPLSVF